MNFESVARRRLFNSCANAILLAACSFAMPAPAQSNIVYAVEYNQATNRFGTINLLNGNFTRISSIGGALINDIAFCPTNGILYGISNTTALVTFNKTNGTMTRIASLSVSGIQSLAFRPSDSVLFGATHNNLYKINIANGTATSVGSFGNAHNLGSTGQNIRFAQDGNLYVSNTSTNTDIYRLNTSTGTATWMGEAIGYPYLILENGGTNTMYGVYINLGSSTNPFPVLTTFDLSSFVVGGTNANGSTHQITINLVGAGTNFPANFNFTGNNSQAVTNLTIPVSAVGPVSQTVCPGDSATFSTVASGTGPYSYAWLKNNVAISGQTNSSLTLYNVSASDAATYSVIVGGAMGRITNSATLTVNTPVTATPLNNVVVCPGNNAVFSTVASGTGPFSYVWLKNGNVISAQTGNSLTLNNVSTGDTATYSVILSGACGSLTNSATLTVNVPVTVTVPPVSQTTVVGSNVTFSVTATGTGLNYQWLFGGSVIGTASSLTLNNVTTGQAGVYTVIVSGVCGNVTNSATLTVNVPVTVTVPPVNQTTVVGSNVTFSVTATGTGLSYQWLFGGSVIGTASSLTLNNVTTGQAGVYTVIVSGVCGSVTNSATLTVNVPVSVTVPPVNQTTVVGSNVTFSVTATGTGLSYQWLFGGSVIGTASSLTLNNVTTGQAGVYTVIVSGVCGSVTNSATLTVNVPVSVQTPPADQTVCLGDIAVFNVTATGTDLSYQWWQGTNLLAGQTNSNLELSDVTADEAGTYSVIVNGACGSVTNSAILTVNTPVTATPLNNMVLCPGDNAVFNTVASGTGPFSYVWLKNGTLISGQNDSSLTLNNVSASDAATYSVIVSGVCGSVTNSATLTVNVPVTVTVPPVSQTTVVGSNVTFSVTATGTGLSYQWLFGGSVIGTASSLTLNNVTTGQAGVYTVIVSGVCGSVTNSATLTVNVPVTVTVPPVNQTTVVGSNVTFSVTATGTGLSYQWLFGGSVIGTASSLTLNNVTTGQAGVYTVIVSGVCGSVTNSATLTVNVPVTVTVPPVSQTTVVGSNVTFSVTATGTGLNYQWLFGGSVIGTASSLTLNNVTTGQAGVYTVIVSGVCGSVTNSATLTVNVPVSVTVPPVNQTTVVGSNVTFSVTATGTGLSYQWLFGSSVIGTASSLTLNNVTTGQAGVYTVIVSGAAGNPVTNSATLTVNVPVTVTALTNLVCCQGDNAAFSTVASGTGPFNYVWLKNGVAINGQTSSSLTLNNVSTNDAATYSVIVSGACGNVTNSATLTVNLPVAPTLSIVYQGDGSGTASASYGVSGQGDSGVKISASGGVPGQRYVLQFSTDLVNWSNVSTNTADSNGLAAFIDSDAKNYQQCFYRTVTP
jgi:hypothetical protein